MCHLVIGIFTPLSLQATGMMDLSEYKNAEAWEAKMIKLIPNYEKVKHHLTDDILMGALGWKSNFYGRVNGCTVDQLKIVCR